MVRAIMILCVLVCYCKDLNAQSLSDSLAIMQPINNFFLGMKQQDTTFIKQQLHPNLHHLNTFRKNKAGLTKIDSIRTRDFMLSIAKNKGAQLEEKIFRPKILLDDVLATVWVDYEFWYNGKLSHTGVDAFTLIKVEAGWQIIAVVDTRKFPK
jgi:hypothetical protein